MADSRQLNSHQLGATVTGKYELSVCCNTSDLDKANTFRQGAVAVRHCR